jgi:hypothetical protein
MKKDVEKNRNVRNRFYASSPPRVGFCVLQKKGQTKLKRAAFSISPPPSSQATARTDASAGFVTAREPHLLTSRLGRSNPKP